MSGNCDSFMIEENFECPTIEDYNFIKQENIPKYFLWFMIMSLFWRYEIE
jgi:hypothetical protein